MATYAQIQQHVRQQSGFVPKSCWIAHVLSDHGLTNRMSPNRGDPAVRRHPCPPEKRAAIVRALSDLGMVD